MGRFRKPEEVAEEVAEVVVMLFKNGYMTGHINVNSGWYLS